MAGSGYLITALIAAMGSSVPSMTSPLPLAPAAATSPSPSVRDQRNSGTGLEKVLWARLDKSRSSRSSSWVGT